MVHPYTPVSLNRRIARNVQTIRVYDLFCIVLEHIYSASNCILTNPLSLHSTPKTTPALMANLPPLTLWQPDLTLPRTILWTTPLI